MILVSRSRKKFRNLKNLTMPPFENLNKHYETTTPKVSSPHGIHIKMKELNNNKNLLLKLFTHVRQLSKKLEITHVPLVGTLRNVNMNSEKL